MNTVYAVFECQAYEGEYLVGIYSSEISAHERAALVEESDCLWAEVRKIEVDKFYEVFTRVGEEI